jgi:hypothetical protein
MSGYGMQIARVRRLAVLALAAALVAGTAACRDQDDGSSAGVGAESGGPAAPATFGVTGDPDDLPTEPGAMAGTFSATWTEGSELRSGLFVVSSAGTTYRLPQDASIESYLPALSPDGSRIAYFPDPAAYVIRDLVSGETVRFPDIRPEGVGPAGAYSSLGSRSFFSPSGEQLLLAGNATLVLGVDGSIRELERPHGASPYVVGWIDDQTVAWVRWGRGRDPDHAETGDLVATPVTGGRATTTALDEVDALDELVEAGVAVSPDGTTLAVVTPDGEHAGSFTLYSTGDGSVLDRSSVDRAVNANCPLSWSAGEPVVALAPDSRDLDGPGGLVTMAGELPVRSPGLVAPCSVWAPGAL